MKTTSVLLIKFITCMIAFAIGLDLFFDATFVDILSFSVLVTTVSYIIGDRILLPRIGNMNAAIVDFFLTYISVWIFGSILFESYLQIAWGSVITATIVAAAELVVHRLILRQTITEDKRETRRGFSGKLAYGMEMAEEQDPRNKRD